MAKLQGPRVKGRSRRASVVAAGSVMAAGIALVGPAAWACTNGAESTSVNPTSGEVGIAHAVSAYTTGGSLTHSGSYTMYFADATLLATLPLGSKTCHHDGVKIGGPAIANTGVNQRDIASTPGTIPASASSGDGAVCFALTTNRANEANDAIFYVSS